MRGSGERRGRKRGPSVCLGSTCMTLVQIRFCWTQVADNSAIFLT